MKSTNTVRLHTSAYCLVWPHTFNFLRTKWERPFFKVAESEKSWLNPQAPKTAVFPQTNAIVVRNKDQAYSINASKLHLKNEIISNATEPTKRRT